MRILVTGATSMIGSALCEKLLEQNHEVLGVVRENSPYDFSGFQKYKFTRIECNMDNYGELAQLISGKIDVAVFTAWNGTRGVDRMNKSMQEANIAHCMAGVKAVASLGCKRIITAGSQAEYGPYASVITEESECNPETEYGKAKLAFYQEVVRYCEEFGIEYREPRFFSLYGPKDYAGTMIMSILNAMQTNGVCELTKGIQMWDYLYIDDAIEALYKLCTQECPNGVYNFGSGDVRQLKEYVEEMRIITGTSAELKYGAIPYPATGMVSLWPDVSKLKTELKWEPKTSFSKGIRNIIHRFST